MPLPKEHEAHEAALRLAGFDRFALDRLAVDGMEPLGSELNRLRGCARSARRGCSGAGSDRAPHEVRRNAEDIRSRRLTLPLSSQPPSL